MRDNGKYGSKITVERGAAKMTQIDLNIPSTQRHRLIIIGGGFGGIHLLRKVRKSNFQIVIIDRENHHTFQPLLYQVATSGLEGEAVTYPIRKLFHGRGETHFRLADVQRIDPEENLVVTNKGDIKYDFLVIATGAEPNFFGMENIAKNANTMKTLGEALEIRNKIIENFESASMMDDKISRQRRLSVVIAGGGPTGVELAGALSEFKNKLFPKEYSTLNSDDFDIYVVEALPKLLPAMSEKASAKSREFLEEMGVIVITDTMIKGFDGERIETEKGGIEANTMFWTAGVKPAAISGLNSESNTKSGRLAVDEFLKVKGYENIFAVGDVAQFTSEDCPDGLPMLASVATQQGRHLGNNFLRMEKRKNAKKFIYRDKGKMATIGEKRAVADLKNWKFQGTFAWFLWLGVHLVTLIGFKNKLIALTNWFWNYTRNDRHSEILTKIKNEYKTT